MPAALGKRIVASTACGKASSLQLRCQITCIRHVLALDRPVYVHFNSALTSCAGVVELPLQAGKEYEFLLSVRGNSCIPRLFTLNAASRLTREEVTLAAPIEGPACRM